MNGKYLIYQGATYFNCNRLTQEEMETIHNWEIASEEKRKAVRDKYKCQTSGLFAREKA